MDGGSLPCTLDGDGGGQDVDPSTHDGGGGCGGLEEVMLDVSLEVEVGELVTLRGAQELHELLVGDDVALVGLAVQLVVLDVLGQQTGDVGAGHHGGVGNVEEVAELGRQGGGGGEAAGPAHDGGGATFGDSCGDGGRLVGLGPRLAPGLLLELDDVLLDHLDDGHDVLQGPGELLQGGQGGHQLVRGGRQTIRGPAGGGC